jgi:DICT domain-containing protein
MDLRTTIDAVRRLEKDLVLFNVDSGEGIADRVAAFFDTQNVRITEAHTASGKPEDIAVLSVDGGVLAVVDVSVLRALVDQQHTGPDDLGFSDTEYEEILGYLKETTFTSYDSEQLLYASREIEDRARRVGQGTIHAGFQRCSLMADQDGIYRNLANHGIEVHAYGMADVPPPDLGSGHVHPVDTDEIAKTWFVVFDGGGDDTQKSALLAEELEADTFYGVWTYDAGIVDRVVAYLDRRYLDPAGATHPQSRD